MPAPGWQNQRRQLAGTTSLRIRIESDLNGEAHLIDINPRTDFTRYNKVLIDSVVLWAPAKSKLSKLSPEDGERLKNNLQTTLRAQLSQSFTVVEQPGPGTMRIRTAITEAHKSRPVLDLVSNVLPIGWVMTGMQRILMH